MSIVQVDTGTQTATISTTHNLTTQTVAKTYVLAIDLNNMAVGDVLEISAWTKTVAAGASRQAYIETLSGVQACASFLSIPIPSVHELRFKITQTNGTGRSFPWAALTLD